MQTSKTLRNLIILTAICTVPLFFVASKTKLATKELLLPDLLKQPEQIVQLSLQTHDQKLTIRRGPASWEIVERSNFPVLKEKVEELLFALADLQKLEPKTANPQNFGLLNVTDVSEPDSEAIQITVTNAAHEDLANLLLGKREGFTMGEEYQEQIMVRTVGDNQVWLAQGIVPIGVDFKDWVDEPLLGLIDSGEIKAVQIQRTKDDKVLISKRTINDEDFVLHDVKAHSGSVLDLDAINSLPYQLAEIEYEDVVAAASINLDWTNSINANLITFSGVNMQIKILRHADRIYVRASASVESSASDELKQKVAEFNQTHQAWYYQISEQFYRDLTVSNSHFLKRVRAS